MNERLAKAEALFHEACERAPEEREAFLRQACGEDADLLREVTALLRAAGIADHWLKDTDCAAAEVDLGSSPFDRISEGPGTVVGRYKLLEKIGEGGFGAVYMAEQAEPVHRRVAFKIIKLGMDTKSVIARFEAERQALALMDHPNIAKVLDAGATATGRPYFVMELVRGVPVTRFCEENQLGTTERLELFIQVCGAVQHAHQKGVIHRDLKPTNVLVTLNDGVPHPMLIDFGVAKAINQRLTEKTLFTNFAQMIGTPAYMSPEQAEMSKLDVDTRSDIYSLGVLLYELLTGSTPFPEERLRSAGYVEMQRIICEEKPPRPSTLFTRTAEPQPNSSPAPRPSPLSSDLDWIVMKCLEKDRTRRYETANGLAMDLRRHLDNQPVLARPPSKLYEFQKTVRRHKVGFAATAAIIIVLAAGILISTWQAVRATEAKQEALAAQAAETKLREHAQAEEKDARTDAARSAAVAQFMKDMLKGVGPSVALGRDTTMLREILDRTAQRIDTKLTNEPEVRVELLNTIGWTYWELGQWESAKRMYRSSLALMTNLWGDNNPEVAVTLHNLAQVFRREGDHAGAEAAERQALAINRRIFGDESPAVTASLTELASVLTDENKLDEAESLFRQALPMTRKLWGDESPQVGLCLSRFGMLLEKEGKIPEAEVMYHDAVEIQTQQLGKNSSELAPNVELAWTLSYLSRVLDREGKSSEAEAGLSNAVAVISKVVRPNHPDRIALLNNLIDLNLRHGSWKQAEAGLTQLVEAEPDETLNWMRLSAVLAFNGQTDQYHESCRKSLDRFSKTEDPVTAEQVAKSCLILPASGVDLDRAARLADFAEQATTDQISISWVQYMKGLAEYRLGHFTDAIAWIQKFQSRETVGKGNNPFAPGFGPDVGAWMVLAMAQDQSGQHEAARVSLAAGLKLANTKLGEQDLGTRNWRDWMIAEVLIREAKTLIESNSATNAPPQ